MGLQDEGEGECPGRVSTLNRCQYEWLFNKTKPLRALHLMATLQLSSGLDFCLAIKKSTVLAEM